LSRDALQLFGLVWCLGEIIFALSRRADSKRSGGRDRGSLGVLWIAITIGIIGAVSLRPYAPIPLPGAARLGIGFVLLTGGFALRAAAVLTLRESFTVNVAIREGQKVIDSGPYAYIRHPAYTGLLLNLLIAYRIAVEERALLDAFGDDYRRYAARKRRLIPWVL
jgi:protein-S-isoprenylcysteine O-methyltransferase